MVEGFASSKHAYLLLRFVKISDNFAAKVLKINTRKQIYDTSKNIEEALVSGTYVFSYFIRIAVN